MDENIVLTNVFYNSFILRQNLTSLIRNFPFLNVQTVGYSILGNPIYVVKLGKGSKKVFYSASIHANEWITSVLLMKFIEDYAKAYVSNETLFNTSINNLFNTSSIYIMPMVNPDGVDLVTGNLSSNFSYYKQAQNIANQFPTIPFPSGWKSNIKGESLINFHLFVFKK